RALHSFPTRRSSDLIPGADACYRNLEHIMSRTGTVACSYKRCCVYILRKLGFQKVTLMYLYLVSKDFQNDDHFPRGAFNDCKMVDRKSTRLNSSHVK